MSSFTDFIKTLSVSDILTLFNNGVFSNEEVLSELRIYISSLVVFEGVELNEGQKIIYEKLLNNLSKDADDSILFGDLFRSNAVDDHSEIIRPIRPSTSKDGPASTTSVIRKINNYCLPSPSRGPINNNTNNQNIVPIGQINQNGLGIVAPKNNKYVIKGLELDHVIKKYGLQSKRLNFTFKTIVDDEEPAKWLQNAFEELIAYMTREFNQDDFVGMVMHNEEYPEKPLAMSFRKLNQVSAAVILRIAENVLQSNARFFSNDQFSIKVDRVTLPVGRGFARNLKCKDFEEFCKKKYGIVHIQNNDNHCLAYALVISIAYLKTDKGLFEIVRCPSGFQYLQSKAFELCADAGVDLSNGGNYDHLTEFQEYLKDYTIVVYTNRLGKTVCFEGSRSPDKKCLNLLLEDNHYSVITSLTAAFSTSYFCELCKKRFSDKKNHQKCPYICPCCHTSPPCKISENKIVCRLCRRDFRGQLCFTAHSEKLCNSLQRCKHCLHSVWLNTKTQKNRHKCGYLYCKTCMKNLPIRHNCFMQVSVRNDKKSSPQKKGELFVFYDIETRQETKRGNSMLHEVNLCVVQQNCFACIDIDDINIDCSNCGPQRQHVFKNEPVKELLNFVSLKTAKFKVTAIAHNMKSFDGCFVLSHLFSNCSRWDPKIIRTGGKIMSITCANNLIRFIDSLNFMPLPLSKLPSAFKFTGVKGYFPHLFNIEANQNYIGPIPEKEFYDYNSMKTVDRVKFIEWHDEQIASEYIFNMSDELIKYCIDDVNILRKACMKFRKCFMEATKIDPLLEAITIASACNLVFRRNFLKADTIGIIPQNGYRMNDNQSSIALKWLMHLENSRNLIISHAGNGREVRLKEGMLVDGYCENTKTVFQFHGCYWHGCEVCYPDQTCELSKKSDSMFMRRERTEAIDKRIRDLGYNLEIMWECKFKAFLFCNPDIDRFLEQHNVKKHFPLNPRDGFFGGRTNACKLYYKCKPGEKIFYYDVCSLYPFINKYSKYPVGHPVIHVGHDNCGKLSFDSVEGLIKCTVLPPQNLYHPVLPYRSNNKLTFPLCRSCVDSCNNDICNHSDKDRVLMGTYVADELRKAVSLGYKIVEFHEIWVYQTVQYDKLSKTGGLFSDYINNFVKIKQENSGWPTWCDTDAEKERYISEYEEHEGIKLDKDNVGHNPGMRFLSKLMLNSFWGKFGQRENLVQSSIIDNPADFFKLLSNEASVVHNISIINEDVLLVSWDKRSEEVDPLKTVNVAIAAYTTAAARLELYSYLEKLHTRVLYFDTDSVIFTWKEGEWMPPTGDYLGDLKDEIAEYGTGSYIDEMVSGGPKNYAFNIQVSSDQGNVKICKVKGITLNYSNSQLINFDTMKSVVCDNADEIIVHNARKIVRNPQYEVLSRPENKKYRYSYTKRRRIENSYDTLPFGFVDNVVVV